MLPPSLLHARNSGGWEGLRERLKNTIFLRAGLRHEFFYKKLPEALTAKLFLPGETVLSVISLRGQALNQNQVPKHQHDTESTQLTNLGLWLSEVGDGTLHIFSLPGKSSWFKR